MNSEAKENRAIARMVRVDHAGERGAVRIYEGQMAIFRHLPHKRRFMDMLGEMLEGEQTHLSKFEKQIVMRQVRPTAMLPLWDVAGFALGAVTALMGERASMACTEAVEDVIEAHYGRQVEAMDVMIEQAEGQDGAEREDFRALLAECREDEAHHRERAIAEGAKEAPAYDVLSSVIKAGCRLAIRISERI
ncbi:MAG: demethoxyubiquinone hydroxylase family protein [Parvularculales bacterium]